MYYFVLGEGRASMSPGWRALFCLSSFVIVMLQLTTTAGLFAGIQQNTCYSNDECRDAGMYCTNPTAEALGSGSFVSRCQHCGAGIARCDEGKGPLCMLNGLTDPEFRTNGGSGERRLITEYDESVPTSMKVFNWTSVSQFCATARAPRQALVDKDYGWAPSQQNWPLSEREWLESLGFGDNWCNACVMMQTREVDTWKWSDKTEGIVKAMASYDWSTLLVASCLVGLACSQELGDIYLTTKLLQRLSAPADGGCCSLENLLYFGLQLLAVLRRHCFLPSLVMIIPHMVYNQGGDCLTVCFNTVAVLFLSDLDNNMYAYGLSESLKREVERRGRVTMSSSEASTLNLVKTLHMLMIMYVIMMGTYFKLGITSLGGPFITFGLGAAFEAMIQPDLPTSTILKRVGIAVASQVLATFFYAFYAVMIYLGSAPE